MQFLHLNTMKSTVLKTFFCSLIFLTACAPAMDGSNVRQPLIWELSETLPIHEFHTTYISIELPPSLFDYDSDDIEAIGGPGISRYDAVGSESNTNIIKSFSLEEIMAPEGWEINLERAYLIREITDRTTKRSSSRYYRYTNINTYYLETFRFTLSVTPTSVNEFEQISITLNSPKGKQTIPISIGSS